MYICDDIMFEQDSFVGVLEYIRLCYHTSTDWLIGLDLYNMDRIAKIPYGELGKDFVDSGMGIIGWDFANRFKDRQCFCPVYKSFYADVELGWYAKINNRFDFFSYTIYPISHSFSEVASDDTHKIVRNKQVVYNDSVAFWHRMDKGLLWGLSFEMGKDYGSPPDEFERLLDKYDGQLNYDTVNPWEKWIKFNVVPEKVISDVKKTKDLEEGL